MYNDLLFPILPREGKVPIKSDNKITSIIKEGKAKGLSEEEREAHAEERRVDEKHQYHQNGEDKPSDERSQHRKQDEKPQQHATVPDVEAEVEVYDEHGELHDHHEASDDDEGKPHLDVYI